MLASLKERIRLIHLGFVVEKRICVVYVGRPIMSFHSKVDNINPFCENLARQKITKQGIAKNPLFTYPKSARFLVGDENKDFDNFCRSANDAQLIQNKAYSSFDTLSL
jgi:hypothetical protein